MLSYILETIELYTGRSILCNSFLHSFSWM